MILPPKRVLLISGSDSSGGAGMQADIAAVRAFGAFPVCAVSCITVQSPSEGLTQILPVDLDIFRAQLESCVKDFMPDAVKIGMLPGREHLQVVTDFLRKYNLQNVVLDPVMAPTAGRKDILGALWSQLSDFSSLGSHISLITPNVAEAERIGKFFFDSPTGDFMMRDVEGESPERRELIKFYSYAGVICNLLNFPAMLITGLIGCEKADESPQISSLLHIHSNPGSLNLEDKEFLISHPLLPTSNSHGTGCTLSSAIAALLSQGVEMPEAVRRADEFVAQSLKNGRDIKWCAEGSGPTLPVFTCNAYQAATINSIIRPLLDLLRQQGYDIDFS